MAQTHDHRLKVLNAAAMNHRAWLKQVKLDFCAPLNSSHRFEYTSLFTTH